MLLCELEQSLGNPNRKIRTEPQESPQTDILPTRQPRTRAGLHLLGSQLRDRFGSIWYIILTGGLGGDSNSNTDPRATYV